jgi:hypothetical protein
MLSFYTSKNKMKAVRQLVHTLCIFYFEDITPRELDVLCEIVHAGEVGYDSKMSFIVNYKASKESYFQVLDRLTRKGILKKKEYKTGKEVHEYFKNVRDIVEGKKDKYIILQYDSD